MFPGRPRLDPLCGAWASVVLTGAWFPAPLPGAQGAYVEPVRGNSAPRGPRATRAPRAILGPQGALGATILDQNLIFFLFAAKSSQNRPGRALEGPWGPYFSYLSSYFPPCGLPIFFLLSYCDLIPYFSFYDSALFPPTAVTLPTLPGCVAVQVRPADAI